MEIKFTVESVPVAQPRARAKKFGKGVYNPTTVKTALGSKPHPIVEFKHAVRQAAFLEMGSLEALPDPMYVGIEFVFPRPQSLLKKSSPAGRIPCVKKPDRDNLDKAVLDAMKGVVFVDDCQAWDGPIRKVYAAIGERAHVSIHVRTTE